MNIILNSFSINVSYKITLKNSIRYFLQFYKLTANFVIRKNEVDS